MVRILHTADWHIGATLRGHDREHEHQAVLDRVIAIAEERGVDAVVVAGDVYDVHSPSAASQALYYRSVTRLARARPGMTVVVVAGNHDGAARLEAPHPPLAALGVRVVGSVRRRDGCIDAERHLIPITVGSDIAAHVLAVSHITAGCLPPLDAAGEGSPIARAVRSIYDALWSGTRHRHAGLPVMVTGHLHVAGGQLTEGSERRILIGGEHAVGPDTFGDECAYVALGHLHRPQFVGRGTVRYSGSLLPLSASEMNYRHGVTIVDHDGRSCSIEHVPLTRPVDFLRLPATGDMLLAELGDHLAALRLPPDLPNHLRPFVQVHLSRVGLPAGYREQVDRLAEGHPVRVVGIQLPQLPEAALAGSGAVATRRLADLDPVDVFEQAFLKEHGHPPGDEHRRVFSLLREEG